VLFCARTGGANAMATMTSVGAMSRTERLAMMDLAFDPNDTAFVLRAG